MNNAGANESSRAPKNMRVRSRAPSTWLRCSASALIRLRSSSTRAMTKSRNTMTESEVRRKICSVVCGLSDRTLKAFSAISSTSRTKTATPSQISVPLRCFCSATLTARITHDYRPAPKSEHMKRSSAMRYEHLTPARFHVRFPYSGTRYPMKRLPNAVSLTVLALAGALALGGCGKTNPPNSENTSQTSAQNPSAPNAAQPNAPAQPGAPNAAPQDQAQNPPAPPAPPPTIVVPAGTHLRVRLDQDLGSKVSQDGESFGATVADDVVVDG